MHTFSAPLEPHPLPARRVYKPQFKEQTGEMAIDYALITVKPNVSANTQ